MQRTSMLDSLRRLGMQLRIDGFEHYEYRECELRVDLNADGTVASYEALRPNGVKSPPALFLIPTKLDPSKRSGPVAQQNKIGFCTDAVQYIGYLDDKDKKKKGKVETSANRLAAFTEYVTTCARVTKDAAVIALENFLGRCKAGTFACPLPEVCKSTSVVIFYYKKKPIIHRAAVIKYWTTYVEQAERGMPTCVCSVSGETGAKATLHQGVSFAGSGGSHKAPLFSYNKESTRAYGLCQVDTFPVTRHTSTCIVTALRRIVENYPKQDDPNILVPTSLAVRWSYKRGDLTFSFWPDKPSTAVTDFLTDLSAALNANAAEELVSALTRLYKMHSIPTFDNTELVHVAIFRGFKGTVSVQSHDVVLASEFLRNIATFFRTTVVFVGGKLTVFSIYDMLRSCQEDKKQVQLHSGFYTQLFNSIVFRHKFPHGLLRSLIDRDVKEAYKPKLHYTRGPKRWALLQAIVYRREGKDDITMRYSEDVVDRDNTNIGYLLGRYLATVDYLHGIANRAAAQRITAQFYSGMLNNPRSTLPKLAERLQALLAAARRRGLGGATTNAQKMLREIMEGGGVQGVPARLSDEDKSWFVLGLHAQEALLANAELRQNYIKNHLNNINGGNENDA